MVVGAVGRRQRLKSCECGQGSNSAAGWSAHLHQTCRAMQRKRTRHTRWPSSSRFDSSMPPLVKGPPHPGQGLAAGIDTLDRVSSPVHEDLSLGITGWIACSTPVACGNRRMAGPVTSAGLTAANRCLPGVLARIWHAGSGKRSEGRLVGLRSRRRLSEGSQLRQRF